MQHKLHYCYLCSNRYSVEMFYKDSTRATGVSSKCKGCMKNNFNKYRHKPTVKITQNLRRRLRGVLKSVGRSSNILRHIGCTKQQLIQHLESKFTYGMSWDNYGYGPGKWVIDHIKPISIF